MKIYTEVSNQVEIDIVHQFLCKMNPEYPYDIVEEHIIEDEDISVVYLDTEEYDNFVITWDNVVNHEFEYVEFKAFLTEVYKYYNRIFIDENEVVFDYNGITVGCTFISKEIVRQIAERLELSGQNNLLIGAT